MHHTGPQGLILGSVRGMEAWPRVFIVVSTERNWQGRIDKLEQAEFGWFSNFKGF